MAPRSQIAHYTLSDKLGEGGMGAVYRATDTKLNRQVAVKILPDLYASDPDRLARFTREAQALAALNHPNIAAIYGVEDRALIMELVEGDELKGPLPLETALEYARQIADALEAAHDKGIIHRDLKPANIKVTPQGVVKVLDFGLAAMAQSTPGVSDPANSPTLTLRATQAGMIMGTAGYMAPEQASGKPVDRRADIWSFGVVLYEMLMGKALFEGETVTHTLASVLKDTIDFEAVQAPPPIRELARRCLERDPRNRLQAIGEARIAIQKFLANPKIGESIAAVQASPRRAGKLPWILAAGLGLAASVFATLWMQPAPPARLMRFEIGAPAGSSLPESVPSPSPDGTMIAYPVKGPDSRNRIHVRQIDKLETRALPGTDEVIHMWWSPDSKSLAFTTPQSRLKRIDIVGGAPRDLTESNGPWHGAWGPDGTILFTTRFGLSRIPAEGGPVTNILQGGFPEILDSKRFLFFLDGHIRLATLGSPKPAQVLDADGSAVLARTPLGKSYLLFPRSNDLFVQPFDERSGTVKGNATVLVSGILKVARALTKPAVAVSPTGILAYQTGAVSTSYGPLVWLDRGGKVMDTLPVESSGMVPELSPDGTRVASQRLGPLGERDAWVTDLARKSSTRLTFPTPGETFNGAAWSPDGKRLATRFRGANTESGGIKILEVGNPANVQTIQGPSRTPHGWSSDGKMLLGASQSGVYSLLPVEGGGKEIPVGSPNGRTTNGQFSPDSKYIAFVSSETGQPEVYVQPIPPGTGYVKVSVHGGSRPRWRRDGRELYFASRDDGMMAVDVKADKTFSAGVPHLLFTMKDLFRTAWDVRADGQQFLIATQPDAGTERTITVVLNWWAELKN
jgi:serine/threonine protein kinase